jgi:hypothetical protein
MDKNELPKKEYNYVVIFGPENLSKILDKEEMLQLMSITDKLLNNNIKLEIDIRKIA